MTTCIPMERLARPQLLTREDREHLAGCPRCASLMAEYASFTEGRVEAVPAQDLADAEAELGALVASELGAARTLAKVTPIGRPWWNAAPARMALVAAALAVMAGTFVVMRGADRAPAPPVLRGAESSPLAVVAQMRATTLMLGWGVEPQADSYRIEIFSAELRTLATFGPVRSPSFTLARGAVAGAASGAEVYCRIVALRAGAPVGESEPLAIRLP
jgi:hypothetical protein